MNFQCLWMVNKDQIDKRIILSIVMLSFLIIISQLVPSQTMCRADWTLLLPRSYSSFTSLVSFSISIFKLESLGE